MSYVNRRNWKNKKTGFSYSDKSRINIRGIILFLFAIFIVFEITSSMFLTSYKVESISMEPTVPSGSVVLASPLFYGPEIPFVSIKIPGVKTPKRGDLVISSPEYQKTNAWYINALDSFISFFTFQQKTFSLKDSNWVNSLMVKRVLGVPGDSVKMVNSEIFIKPEGKNYFFSEKEIMQVEYSTENYSLPNLMSEDLPLSGNMEEILLKDGEFFLAGDNRSMSNDSYYWGPVSLDKIKARVLLEYAPAIKILQ